MSASSSGTKERFVTKWGLILSVLGIAPDTWYNPLSPFSVATVLVQWGIVMGLFKLYNNRIAEKTILN